MQSRPANLVTSRILDGDAKSNLAVEVGLIELRQNQ